MYKLIIKVIRGWLFERFVIYIYLPAEFRCACMGIVFQFVLGILVKYALTPWVGIIDWERSQELTRITD